MSPLGRNKDGSISSYPPGSAEHEVNFDDMPSACGYAGCVTHPAPQVPRRGDEVEAWLKARRDVYSACKRDAASHLLIAGCELAYEVLDSALDDYRRHADTGTPLSAEIRERDDG